ncbi:MAG: hydroxypyruvate isomerase [Methylibium sp.]|nr:hydroxypyruvate isomerase [Methylibium sp.]
MLKLAANLDWLYTELPFLDRFAAAARDGFSAVEILFPYAHGLSAIRDCLLAQRLQLVLLNAPPGDWAAGERGLACLPGREADFRAAIEQAIALASALACPRIHVMAGLLPAGAERADVQPLYISNLRWAAEHAAAAGLALSIEPINGRDMPGYFLNRQDHALEIIDAVGAPNLGLQMDWYHCQIVEGDLSHKLRRAAAAGRLAHVQVAAVPDRGEPDQGELRVEHLLALLDELGYQGHIGCEYKPRAGTSAGLGWARRYLKPAAA